MAESAAARLRARIGAGIANAQLGVPDIGLLTATEMLVQTERIVAAVEVPVVADLDTGYRALAQRYDKVENRGE